MIHVSGVLNVSEHAHNVLEMISWSGCKAKQITSVPRTDDFVGCKRSESSCPIDFLSVRVYLWIETAYKSMGIVY